jgi:hypothetical protein
MPARRRHHNENRLKNTYRTRKALHPRKTKTPKVRGVGLQRAELGVEISNPRARVLYEKLGYAAYGTEPDSWDQEAPDGAVTRYETVLTLMRKELS